MKFSASLLGTATLLISTTAWPQGSDPVAARAQLQQGYALKQQGKCEEALPHFIESVKLDRHPKALVNLADCEEKVGRLAAALTHFVEARDLAKAQGLEPLRAAAEQHINGLEKRMPKLRIKLTKDAPAGTTVTRDGVELGSISLGSALPIDPGKHVILARSTRFERRYEVSIEPGEAKDLEVTSEGGTPLPSASPAPAETPSSPPAVPPLASPGTPASTPTSPIVDKSSTLQLETRSSGSSARTVVLLGETAIVVGGLAVGGIFLAKAMSSQTTIDDTQSTLDSRQQRCEAGAPRVPECDTLHAALQDRQDQRKVATIGFIGAGVGAIVLTATWLAWSPSRGGPVAVLPLTEPHAHGLKVNWRF